MYNILKFTFILCVAMSFNFNTFGQHQLGIKAGGGLSKITTSREDPNSTVTTPFVPSGQAGLYYNHLIGKKISLGAELLFSQIEGKEKREIDLVDVEGNNVGHATVLIHRHVSYLSLPVYFGFNIKILTINGGLQLSHIISGSDKDKHDAIINGERFKSENKSLNNPFSKFELGPRAGIHYRLSDRVAVEGTYYYGISNIEKGVPIINELKVQQMTLGIRYALWNKKTAR